VASENWAIAWAAAAINRSVMRPARATVTPNRSPGKISALLAHDLAFRFTQSISPSAHTQILVQHAAAERGQGPTDARPMKWHPSGAAHRSGCLLVGGAFLSTPMHACRRPGPVDQVEVTLPATPDVQE
jgi:hypothetical protein